jgi:hypothetical protein
MTDPEDLSKKIKKLEKHIGKKVQTISLYEDDEIKSFSQNFLKTLEENTKVPEILEKVDENQD